MTSLRTSVTRCCRGVAVTAAAVGLVVATVPAAPPAGAGSPYAAGTPVPLPPAAGHDIPPLASPVPARPAGSGGVDAPAVPPVPPTPSGLPTAADLLSPYIPQRSCDYTAKPGVSAFQDLVERTYPDTGSYGIVNTCLREVTTSEHAEGRAWDWAVSTSNPAQVAEVDALLGWLLATDGQGNVAAMARRLGLMYIIWNKQIWGTYAASSGWRPFSCSGVTACHQDHVHFSFSWAGAWKRTSYWSKALAALDYGPCVPAGQRYAPAYGGINPTPCPSHVPPPAPTSDLQLMQQNQYLVAVEGDAGTPVAVIQRQVRATVDGQYGPGTAAGVRAYQSAHGLPATGSVATATWRSFVGAAPAPTVAWATTPAPATVAAGTGANLFARTPAGGLARKDYRDGSWSGWAPVSGLVSGAPTATVGRAGVQVAVRSTDGHVYLGTVAGSPWQALGGTATSSPSVTAGPYGTELFVRGPDGGIWTRTPDLASRWSPLGGSCLSAPAAAVGPDGSAVVVVVATNRVLYQNRRSSGRWSGWSVIGGVIAADPALSLVPGTGSLLTVVRGSDAQAYAAAGSLGSAAWSSWSRLGGSLTSGGTVASTGPGASRVTVYGPAGQLYEKRGGPAWSSWSAIP